MVTALTVPVPPRRVFGAGLCTGPMTGAGARIIGAVAIGPSAVPAGLELRHQSSAKGPARISRRKGSVSSCHWAGVRTTG